MENTTVKQPEIRTDIPVPRNSLYTRYIKRLLDIVLSGTAILVLSPALLVICILELIYHGRPIFYLDKRPGKDGKIFCLYKFRSMNNACDENGKLLHPSKRITPFGRFIRRFSIDELGGLFNILNGTMSIIGPRPLMVDYLPLYNERHKYRHAVRPGLACWDLKSDGKLTAASWTWNAQFENDIYYVENVSFWLDVKMVFKTVQVVFSKSEMRTNSDRIKFDGNNLTETRTRSEILKAQEAAEKAAAQKQD
ncbi:MAG: sugar transferase [Clostridia bacterium]|nr:sugar transferase [Clostridia bacterium]